MKKNRRQSTWLTTSKITQHEKTKPPQMKRTYFFCKERLFLSFKVHFNLWSSALVLHLKVKEKAIESAGFSLISLDYSRRFSNSFFSVQRQITHQEWPVFHVRLDGGLFKLSPDETFCICKKRIDFVSTFEKPTWRTPRISASNPRKHFLLQFLHHNHFSLKLLFLFKLKKLEQTTKTTKTHRKQYSKG